jgi:anti-sigma28 factor (negative regulator of flagellin synthesis)
MDNKKMVKQMIDLHKTSFGNCFSTMVTLQDQAEKLMKTFVDHTPGISDEGKKVIDQWTDAYKKGVDDLKKAIDEGYYKVDEFFNSNAMVMLQDYTEKMFDAFLNQRNWMPIDLKKTMEELTATYKNGCDDFKKQVDESVQRMGKIFPANDKTQTNNKQQE